MNCKLRDTWHHDVILWRPSIHLEGPRKPTTVLSQDIGSTSPDFNSGRLPMDMEQVSLRYKHLSFRLSGPPTYNVVNRSKMKAIRRPHLHFCCSLAINHGLATVAYFTQYMARCNRDLCSWDEEIWIQLDLSTGPVSIIRSIWTRATTFLVCLFVRQHR